MWGNAMGKEFIDKGSNVQLGPGMCVARVPRNGRNFEYISGEDPYLGSELVGPVIEAIQSHGVIANARFEISILLIIGKLAKQQGVTNFYKVRLFRQLFNGVAAVQQYALAAIDIGDCGLAGRGGHEAGIVGKQAFRT